MINDYLRKLIILFFEHKQIILPLDKECKIELSEPVTEVSEFAKTIIIKFESPLDNTSYHLTYDKSNFVDGLTLEEKLQILIEKFIIKEE